MRRIATVNVNGIRAAHRRGFGDWLTTRGSDVIALQEVRAQADKLPAAAFGCYHVAFDPGSLPGRNGVAVLTRQEPAAIRTDRKSTRLNSSHVAISYAVFCLKKKT